MEAYMLICYVRTEFSKIVDSAYLYILHHSVGFAGPSIIIVCGWAEICKDYSLSEAHPLC